MLVDFQGYVRARLHQYAARPRAPIFGPTAIERKLELVAPCLEECFEPKLPITDLRHPVGGVGRVPVVERAGNIDLRCECICRRLVGANGQSRGWNRDQTEPAGQKSGGAPMLHTLFLPSGFINDKATRPAPLCAEILVALLAAILRDPGIPDACRELGHCNWPSDFVVVSSSPSRRS